jgi:hypothetical protein
VQGQDLRLISIFKCRNAMRVRVDVHPPRRRRTTGTS